MKEDKDLKLTQKPYASWAFEKERMHPWAFWSEAITPDECQKIIDYAEQFNKEDAYVSLNNKVDLSVRESKIVWITPDPEINWLYGKLTAIIVRLNEDYFNFDLFGFIEGLQFTEYNAPSGYYDKHVDTRYKGPVRKLSFVLQLSDPKDYEGGELHLHFKKTPDIMKKEQGTLIAFSSTTLHEVTPVTKGKRYSLVGWITGKPFK
jgi:PKHD-type hydroxylase